MRKIVVISITIAAFVLLLGATASADVKAEWGAPTTGSPVEVYQVELQANGELVASYETTETILIIPQDVFQVGTPYVARVRGVDDLGREGPWTPWSEPYIDDGTPGACTSITLSRNR